MSKLDRKHCVGCRDNFYNMNNMGANMDTGRPECWMLDSAVLVSARDIPTDLRPPYNHIAPTDRPNCYKAKGYVRVKPEALTAAGYWK